MLQYTISIILFYYNLESVRGDCFDVLDVCGVESVANLLREDILNINMIKI